MKSMVKVKVHKSVSWIEHALEFKVGQSLWMSRLS